ncbi:MAG: hypothetical protein HYV28_03555 [Ignavibacteriales bacterium]|nr:hypothetical protein [Ignavibacteriales bacterium]
MSEKSIIQGWSIVQGDYLRDPEYDDEFIKTKKKKLVMQKTIFSIGAVLAVGTFVAVMSVMTNFLK